ncbi:MAG: tail fiber domain-containing protein [Bacteroidetes bacterium]|nr:tail fiber domain-containing protein [Bacteroidota bacterium]
MSPQLCIKVVFVFMVIAIVSGKEGFAQTGIATTSPNSTLDVRGSMATKYRTFNSTTTATAADHILVFSGSVASSLNLPSAVGCAARFYLIKNSSLTNPLPALQIIPAGTEKIDGASSWTLDEPYSSILLVSNNSNWHIAAQYSPALLSGLNWIQNGNSLSSARPIGTISSYDLPFITNNTEKMRLSVSGSLGVGSSVFDAVNPEKMLVDAGTTTSFNIVSGKGTINNYLQLNIQNRSAGNAASSDVVASANNGSEAANFIDMGINSSAYSNTASPVLDGANNAYLYSTGNDFLIGNGTASKRLAVFTGGLNTTNEYMTITDAGNVGVDTISPSEKLQVEGNIRLSGNNQSVFFDASIDPYAGIKNIVRATGINELMLWSGNDIAGSYGPDRIRLASHEIYFATTTAGAGVSGDPTSFFEDTSAVPTRMLINKDGNVAIGTTNFNSISPEQLLVDAGNTSSYNVISGKGSYNNYLQLNIQNSSGTSSASSDIVATADNGDEYSKFVDLGINSGSYTGTGITGGANNAYLFTTGNDFIIGNNTDNKSLIFYTSTGGNSTQRMSVSNAGLIPAANNSYSLGNNTKRNTAVWAVNGTIQTSDRRMKKNIYPLGYGLNAVLQLRPVRFNWTNENDNRSKIGLIAQEVKQIIPEVVIGDDAKEMLGVNYAELIPALINAVKELKEKTEALRKEAMALHLIQ